MQKIIAEITTSLDGFIAGTAISENEPMGRGGTRLHNWIFNDKTERDDELVKEIINSSGAVIVGARTYRTAIADAWGGASPFAVPAFVICNNIPETKVAGFTYITDGIMSALSQAKTAAIEKNVWVMGGANIIQQYLQQKLLDELHLHIAPVLFCEGTSLFGFIGNKHIELKKTKVADTPAATHIYYDVVK